MHTMARDWMLHDPGAADFAKIYLAHVDQLWDDAEASLLAHPACGPFLRARSKEDKARSRARLRGTVEAAFGGDWWAYEDELRTQGAGYAKSGLAYADWFEVMSRTSRTFLPLLARALHHDVDRLTAALVTNELFVKSVLLAVSEAFLAVSEAQLRRSEAKLRATVESMGDGLIATDAVGTITRMNAEATRLVGVGAHAGVGQSLDQVRRVTPALDAGEGDFALEVPGGAALAIHASRAPIVTDLGTSGEVVVFRDMTASRRREDELRRWEAVFRSVPWGMCITDKNGADIALCNDAFATLYGIEASDLVGTLFADRFEPASLAQVIAERREAARASGQTHYDAIHVRKDGTKFPVQIEAARLPSVAGDTTWAISVRDVSERVKLAALEARGAELEEENRRVHEANRTKSEFVANMSHELRTPLNSILGFSELLYDGQVGELTETQHQFVGDIQASGRHLLRLINDVLDLSKVEAGRMEFFPEEGDLHAFVAEGAAVLRAVADQKKIVIAVDVDPSLGPIFLDAVRLRQVLYNYLSNALKFSPNGGTVTVRVRPEGDAWFRLEVVDRGVGISSEGQRRLFTQFEQLEPVLAKTRGGAGLGLALTRRLVEAQGGTVGVESTPGEGSTFFAVLPLRSRVKATLPQPRRYSVAGSDAPRVLVVEDDAADQDRIISVLVSAGYAVDTAATRAQALRAIDERVYDAITLDLLLPDANGLEVLAALRTTPNGKDTPVIVLSQVSEHVTGGFAVHDVLAKPLVGDVLVASLARARVAPPGEGPVLVIDDDEPSAKLAARSIEHLGFRAVVAADGAAALERARAERPVAVVLDLVMPKLDGFAFLEQFRRERAWAHVPVLVWSVKDLSADEQRMLSGSAHAVLTKDGTGARALVEAIRSVLPGLRRPR